MFYTSNIPNYRKEDMYNSDYYPMELPKLPKKETEKKPTTTSATTNSIYNLNAIINQKLAEQKALLEQRYNQSIANIDSAYNTSKSQINTNKNSELQQQYINNQLALKKMPEQLAQMGANGGMSETSLIQSKSNYENNRNKTMEFFENKLSELMASRDKEKANAQMGLSENLANLQAEYYKDVISALSKQTSSSSTSSKKASDITKNPYYTYITKSIEGGLSLTEAAAKARDNDASEEVVNEILDYLLNSK